MSRSGWFLACLALLTAVPFAQQPPLETVRVRGQVSLVSAGGANALVQVGSQGVLVVDPLAASSAERLLDSVRTLAGNRPIGYVLNTNVRADHTGGNEAIAAAGSQQVSGNFAAQLGGAGAKGAFIVAHENVLHRLSGAVGGGPAVPTGGWPTDTFFQAEKTMYFNGEGIQLRHIPAATSDGDILVFFRSSDVIAAGDLFNMDSYPEIDTALGGTVDGVIEGLNTLIDLAISEQFTEGGTRIVPGHGRITDEFDVVEYRDMVTIVRDRVQAMKRKRMTVEQARAARPTFEYDRRFAASRSAADAFVERVYRTVK